MSPNSKRKCFDGRITDGKATLRFVGFTTEQQEQISKNAANDPIAIAECSIRNTRTGNSLEIIVHDNTIISKSTKKFDVGVKPNIHNTDTTIELLLANLKLQPSFQKVCVSAKVLEIGDTHTLTDGRRVQTVLIADHTDTAEVSLWEDFIGAVHVEESYKLHCLMVKIFNDKLSLFTPKANLQIEKIPDLQDVVSQVSSVKRTKEMQHAQIIAV